MKVTVILAEAATNHPDGTVSMLRAGIQRLWSPQVPAGLMGALVVRIEGETGETAGEHAFTLRVLDEDGKDVMPKLPGKFGLPDGAGAINLVINFQVQFPAYQTYGFYVNIDNVKYDHWRLTVARPPEKPATA